MNVVVMPTVLPNRKKNGIVKKDGQRPFSSGYSRVGLGLVSVSAEVATRDFGDGLTR